MISNIRRNGWETNSSSVHQLAIRKHSTPEDRMIPTELNIKFMPLEYNDAPPRHFVGIFTTPDEKASILVGLLRSIAEWACDLGRVDTNGVVNFDEVIRVSHWANQNMLLLFSTLMADGVTAYVDVDSFAPSDEYDKWSEYGNGSIGDSIALINKIFTSDETLRSYLYDPRSCYIVADHPDIEIWDRMDELDNDPTNYSVYRMQD